MGVPPYNGDLFARDGFDGASTLEEMEIVDPDMAIILVGLGLDQQNGVGIDYSTLEIGNLGNIYEGLLSLRLSVADEPLHYDPRMDKYAAASPGETTDVVPGDLLWQTNEGGRKGGGVYYTPSQLVRHVIRQTVRPAFATHLEEIRELAKTDPGMATDQLLDFAVLDPACGSAHFLVVVVAELADQLVRFLADTPLPEVRAHLDRLRAGATATVTIDDVALIRRLVLKQCVFGVDVSPMGAEVAKLSLWLSSFVPGLSLTYLGRNVVVGNSLIGVARPEAIRGSNGTYAHRRRRGRTSPGLSVPDEPSWLDAVLERALDEATTAVARIASSDDRTPDEVEQSEAADGEARNATKRLEALFDLWTAEPFGVAGARSHVELHGAAILDGTNTGLATKSHALAREHEFLHWPLAFPRVFSRMRPGFDVVVGNPPWNEVTIEEQSFYALFKPGIRRGISEAARTAAVDRLIEERPDLPQRLRAAQERARVERDALNAGEYPAMSGDPDLYKFFCQRYRLLTRDGGFLGVVLPRTTFVNQGSVGFRKWLFEESTCHRVDFLLNTRRWIFDTHPQYAVALVAAERRPPEASYGFRIAGTAASPQEWEVQSSGPGIAVTRALLGGDWRLPLLRTDREAALLERLRRGSRFPTGAGGRWRCFPVAELHETNDRALWGDATEGWPLWKGESFGQYHPHGNGARVSSFEGCHD